ncbi:radical SAM protein [Candidatus Micrarchaeota archaeon]|nr:radical SAM protein [Candidatus Micrarchaeota archaeon]
MDAVKKLYSMMNPCVLCPRRCKVNRFERTGYCSVNGKPIVSSYFPHHGEEAVLRGVKGSGTVFFTGCNLKCVFCQNYDISHLLHGHETTVEMLASMMVELMNMGCHNLNLVTPTHQIPFIIDAIETVKSQGHDLVPIVYNTGGYDSLEVLRTIEGYIDVYLPDIKFFDRKACQRYMNAPDYPDVVKECVVEMYDQVGALRTDGQGIARKGVIIRHLVMPGYVDDSKRIMDWIAETVSKASVNIMAQYRPCYRAREFPEINRMITFDEYMEVVDYAESIGIRLLRE